MGIKDFIFRQWKKNDEQQNVIKTLWKFIGALLVINIFLFFGWWNAPKKLRIYLPPDITEGVWVKPNAVPKATVYAFAYQIFTAVNTWTNNGDTDYKKNIDSYKNYFSVSFAQKLLTDDANRAAGGALTRKRIVSGVTGMGYAPNSVIRLGSGSWKVLLHLHVVETVDASIVKDVMMDYPLIVSRVNESIQLNPWGLAITDFYAEPKRIKTII